MVWGRGDGVTLTDKDRLLAVALRLYEDSLCSGCGMSMLFTGHDDYDGHFETVRTADCLSCKSINQWRDKLGDKNIPSHEGWGTRFNGTPHNGLIVFPNALKKKPPKRREE